MSQLVRPMRLEPDDGLAAQAATADLFQHLPGAIQVSEGTDARRDRTVSEHLRDRGQPFGRYQRIRA